jgi:hypothetical protein
MRDFDAQAGHPKADVESAGIEHPAYQAGGRPRVFRQKQQSRPKATKMLSS